MASHFRSATPVSTPGVLLDRVTATARRRSAPGMIPLPARTRAAWGALRDVAFAVPGTVIVGLDGTTLRIREDGGADDVRTVPRR